MFRETVIYLARSIVVVFAAACMLAVMPSCEQTPQCPDIVINEGEDGDGTFQEPLIPAGAKFFSAYYENGYAPVLIDPDAPPNSRIVITRIDYLFLYAAFMTHKFEFLSTTDAVIGEYRLPRVDILYGGSLAGTQFLHMPIDQGGTGGGLGFAFGNSSDRVWKFRVAGDLPYPESMIQATIFGYTYTP